MQEELRRRGAGCEAAEHAAEFSSSVAVARQ